MCQVDPHDAAGGPDDLSGDLEPSAGPCTEIHDAVAASEDACALLQLEQLVRCARSISFALGTLMKRVLPVEHSSLPSSFPAPSKFPSRAPSTKTGRAVRALEETTWRSS